MAAAQGIPFVAFVRDVLGVTLTPAQTVLVAVAYDHADPVALPVGDRELARQLFGDVDTIPPVARSVLVAVCGARAGKTYVLGALYSLWRALIADLSSLAPGEHAVALLVAPDQRLARQILRYALGAAKSVPSVARLIQSETVDNFTLRRPDGRIVALETLPAARGGSSVRGRSLVSAVMDECAFFRDQHYQVCDVEVFRAIAPRIMPGGMVVLASTPWSESGLLFEEFQRNGNGRPVTALAAHAPTLLLRGDAHTRQMVERERARDADNARREFAAEFMPYGSGLFFDAQAIERACATTAPSPTGHVQDASIGADLGLVADSTAFVAVRLIGGIFSVLDVVELRPRPGEPLKLSAVVAEAARFAMRHRATTAHCDHHVLEPAREHAQRGFYLQAVPGGQAAKVERFVTVRNLLNEGRLHIPPDFPRLAMQLREVISKPATGGSLQITLPRRAGVHGDIVSTFVLAAWHAHEAVGWGSPVAMVGGKRRFAAGELDVFCPGRFDRHSGGF